MFGLLRKPLFRYNSKIIREKHLVENLLFSLNWHWFIQNKLLLKFLRYVRTFSKSVPYQANQRFFFVGGNAMIYLPHEFLLPLNVNCYISEWGRIYWSRLPQAWSFSMWRHRESLAFWRLWYILQFMWIFNGFRIVCNVVTNGEKFNAYDLHTFYCLVLFTLPVHIVKILIRSIIRCVATTNYTTLVIVILALLRRRFYFPLIFCWSRLLLQL